MQGLALQLGVRGMRRPLPVKAFLPNGRARTCQKKNIKGGTMFQDERFTSRGTKYHYSAYGYNMQCSGVGPLFPCSFFFKREQ